MAVIGVQYRSKPASFSATATYPPDTEISKLTSFLTNTPETAQPSFWDLASVTDANDAYNIAIFAYWSSKSAYEEWSISSGFLSWWQSLDATTSGHGWFLEVLTPSTNRLEHVTTTKEVHEGAGRMREKLSCPIKEHGYWGSIRDRFPAAQTDELNGKKLQGQPLHNADAEKKIDTLNSRVRIPAMKNLCVIRSGQDWSCTSPKERKLYLEALHPLLTSGMEFLRDSGHFIGCYSCRLMSQVDPETLKTDKDRTFAFAYFDELASLENYARSHKTHLGIFERFLEYVEELDNEVRLKLWHDVLVVEEEQQFFEYVGCHEGTGMLPSL